ncbi:flagellar basal body-associated FliL family protein [Sphingomonas profundi]|uniref:flagellar basal body-associated FliL family protein n=1 Tax=Alterirhizorhabdus profundi TaxID=2681549 RepID=UPI0012E8E8D0|nr:flagellar basal body-associated FliL family protein [Sphingomonas profundi]
MSDDAKTPAPPKKGGKMKKLLMIGGGALLLLGGGGAAGMYAGGKLGASGGHEAKEDPDAPKLVLKEGEHGPTSVKGGHGGDGDGPVDAEIYKATYYPLEQTFTSNLTDTNGFAQIGLGVSTYYDQKVLDNLKDNEMPVRSAILMTLADQQADTLSTPEGKKMLQKNLKLAINDVLKQKTGFGGIDDVYFTSFIIS